MRGTCTSCRVPDRDRVLERLNEQGVGAAVHYPVPLHLTPALRHLGFGPWGTFPSRSRQPTRFFPCRSSRTSRPHSRSASLRRSPMRSGDPRATAQEHSPAGRPDRSFIQMRST